MADKTSEASIKLPDGTEITVKGSRAHVAEIISSVAANARNSPDASTAGGGSAGGDGRRPGGKLDGVAEKDAEGRVHLVATNLKAKSAIDAAQRLMYLTLLARRQLLNETNCPRKVVVEALRKWTLYDGNSRALLAADRALLKDGLKAISLSNPAVETAWGYVREIQDTKVQGTWRPSGRRPRRGQSRRRGSTESA